jgi:hypothetical protein
MGQVAEMSYSAGTVADGARPDARERRPVTGPGGGPANARGFLGYSGITALNGYLPCM